MRRLLLMALMALVVISCGKKTPPRWVEPVALPAPANLSAHYADGQVRLSWQYPANPPAGFDGFAVYRQTDGRQVEVKRQKASGFTEEIDLSGQSVSYIIKALDSRSGMKNIASEPLALGPFDPLPKAVLLRYALTPEGVFISWESQAAKGFRIYRKIDDGEYRPLNDGPLAEPSITDKKAAGLDAQYIVRSVVSQNGRITIEGPPSDALTIKALDYVPAPPENLEASVATGGVVLIWAESPEQWAKGYDVYRAVDGGEPTLIGTTRVSAYTDTAPPTGLLTYTVCAKGPVAISDPSAPFTIRQAR